VQQESTGVSNQGHTATAGIPCTMVLRLIRDLPGDRAFLPPSPQSARLRAPGLSASVGAPGPHDFAVRCNINRPSMRRVHRIPLPTFVTIAKRPSFRERDPHVLNLIWGQREAESFCARGWTGFRARSFFARRANHCAGLMHRAARTVVISRCLFHHADCQINPRLQVSSKLTGLKDSRRASALRGRGLKRSVG
jgi:hypothetical protein